MRLLFLCIFGEKRDRVLEKMPKAGNLPKMS